MFICTVLILSGLLSRPIVADLFWQEPNAWEIHSPSVQGSPACEYISNADNENSITTMYYKEMVTHLFNRNTLKVNPKTDYLERTITLTLTRAQLKIIESSSDIRDFNSVVMAVLKGAKEPIEEIKEQSNNESPVFSYLSKFQYICELIYLMAARVFKFLSNIFFYSSEVHFAIIFCAVMLAMWLIHKSYNKNLIIVIVVFLVMFGYIFTYVECNRKLKVESVVEFIKDSEPDRPSFFGTFFGKFFDLSERDKKIKKVIEDTKVNLPFCRPDEVAIMYFNDIFFTQLQVVVEKIVESMARIRNTLPFPLNYMGMIALPFLFMSILPLLFQKAFNPSLWVNIIRDTSTRYNRAEDNYVQQGDRLSGENLKIILDVLKTKTQVEEKPKNSAVEDVKDIPQAIVSKLDAEETNDGEKLNALIGDSLEDEESKKEC